MKNSRMILADSSPGFDAELAKVTFSRVSNVTGNISESIESFGCVAKIVADADQLHWRVLLEDTLEGVVYEIGLVWPEIKPRKLAWPAGGLLEFEQVMSRTECRVYSIDVEGHRVIRVVPFWPTGPDEADLFELRADSFGLTRTPAERAIKCRPGGRIEVDQKRVYLLYGAAGYAQ